MKPTHKRRRSEATLAAIDERRRALVRNYQTASDFTDEIGRLVTGIEVDLNELKPWLVWVGRGVPRTRNHRTAPQRSQV